jgi:hypothetical protein
MGMKLLGNVVSMIGYKRPLLLFGLPGVLLCAAGVIVAVLTMFEIYLFGASFMLQTLAAMVMFLTGCFFAISGLTLNSLTLMMRDMQRRP